MLVLVELLSSTGHRERVSCAAIDQPHTGSGGVSQPLSLQVYAGRRTMLSGRVSANLYGDLAAA
jgi:hypothetical protein